MIGLLLSPSPVTIILIKQWDGKKMNAKQNVIVKYAETMYSTMRVCRAYIHGLKTKPRSHRSCQRWLNDARLAVHSFIYHHAQSWVLLDTCHGGPAGKQDVTVTVDADCGDIWDAAQLAQYTTLLDFAAQILPIVTPKRKSNQKKLNPFLYHLRLPSACSRQVCRRWVFRRLPSRRWCPNTSGKSRQHQFSWSHV